jgi:hypothetical protein
VLNTSLVYSPDGECVARYDKIHLFQFDNGRESYTEAAVVQAGSQPVVCDVQARNGVSWRLGLSVCYDLRFPELYRALSAQGADLLLVPSAFTYTTGQAHWEVLLRARAIENLAYVLAPGQGGVHENGRRTWGHSLLIDPWGEVQGLQASGTGVVAGELNRDRLLQVRQQLPAWPSCAVTDPLNTALDELPEDHPAHWPWRRWRMAWKRWSLWTLLVALVVSMLVTMVWLAGRYEHRRCRKSWSAIPPMPLAISVQRWAAICRTCWR